MPDMTIKRCYKLMSSSVACVAKAIVGTMRWWNGFLAL